MKNCDVSAFDVNNADYEKREYEESNDRCQICDKPCVGLFCDYHRLLKERGEI